MDSFEVIRYITETMKKSGIKKGDTSHDTIERIISVAKRALESQESDFRSNEQLGFFKVGDRWGAEIL